MPPSLPRPTEPDAPPAPRGVWPTADQVLAVWCGGTVGCGLRALIDAAMPGGNGIPVATLLVNLLGAFTLALLLGALGLRGDDSGVRRRARLLLGTGLLGGFTTYSTFALQSADLLRDGRTGLASLYVGGSVVGGIALAYAGGTIARLTMRPR